MASAPDSAGGSTEVPFTVTAKAKVLSPTGPRYVTGSESGVLTMTNGQPAGWKLNGNPSRMPSGRVQASACCRTWGAHHLGRPAPPPPPPPPTRTSYGK